MAFRQLEMLVRGDVIDYSSESLPRGPLRRRVEQLAASVNFPLGKVVVDNRKILTHIV